MTSPREAAAVDIDKVVERDKVKVSRALPGPEVSPVPCLFTLNIDIVSTFGNGSDIDTTSDNLTNIQRKLLRIVAN